MSLIRDPKGNYKNEIIKGRFYRCPASIPSSSLILVRPLYDGKPTETIAADITPLDQCATAFNHTSPYPELKLKTDEEFVLYKAKMRRVLATTGVTAYGLIQVAPVYSLKGYHSDMYDLAKLKKNELPGILYLEESKSNAESFVALMDSFPTYKNLIEPIRFELSPEGIELLDHNLVLIHDIYSDSK